MSIKIKNSELLDLYQTLDKIATLTENENNTINNVEVDYWLIRIISKVKPILDDFYKVRNNIIKKYGVEITEEKNGEFISTGEYKVLPEKFDQYQKEMLSLLEQEVEIDGINKKSAKLVFENLLFLPLKFKLFLLPILEQEEDKE